MNSMIPLNQQTMEKESQVQTVWIQPWTFKQMCSWSSHLHPSINIGYKFNPRVSQDVGSGNILHNPTEDKSDAES